MALNGGIADLPEPIRSALMPVVADIESRVRTEAEKAAKKGAADAVTPMIVALGVATGAAIILAYRANRVIANRGLAGIRRRSRR